MNTMVVGKYGFEKPTGTKPKKLLPNVVAPPTSGMPEGRDRWMLPAVPDTEATAVPVLAWGSPPCPRRGAPSARKRRSVASTSASVALVGLAKPIATSDARDAAIAPAGPNRRMPSLPPGSLQ